MIRICKSLAQGFFIVKPKSILPSPNLWESDSNNYTADQSFPWQIDSFRKNTAQKDVYKRQVLMTMHAAKGLEFDYVFIVGLEEGIFPSEMSRYSNEDLEEERRLCYVGITRARKELYLSSANSRMMFGQTKRNKHSRFLDEIDPDLLTVEQSPVARQMQMVRQRYQSDARGGYPSNNSGAYLNREYNRVPANSTGVNITIKPRQTGTRLTSGIQAGSAIQAGSVAAVSYTHLEENILLLNVLRIQFFLEPLFIFSGILEILFQKDAVNDQADRWVFLHESQIKIFRCHRSLDVYKRQGPSCDAGGTSDCARFHNVGTAEAPADRAGSIHEKHLSLIHI